MINTSRQDLIASLELIQRHPAHNHHDILTIHYCRPLSTEAELHHAIEANMSMIARWSDYGGSKRRLANAA